MKPVKNNHRAPNPTARRLQAELRTHYLAYRDNGKVGSAMRLARLMGLKQAQTSTYLKEGTNLTLRIFCMVAEALGLELRMITKEQASMRQLFVTNDELAHINKILSQFPIINLER
jgi:hypothetical protein